METKTLNEKTTLLECAFKANDLHKMISQSSLRGSEYEEADSLMIKLRTFLNGVVYKYIEGSGESSTDGTCLKGIFTQENGINKIDGKPVHPWSVGIIPIKS